MKKFDVRHLAFHVLVALYFIWMAVFGTLMGMALVNNFSENQTTLSLLFTQWIFMNLIMGTALFLVIRMFRNRTVLDKIIFGSYIFLALASVIVVLMIRQA